MLIRLMIQTSQTRPPLEFLNPSCTSIWSSHPDQPPTNPCLPGDFENLPAGNIRQPNNSPSICDKIASSDDLAEVEKEAAAVITPHDELICPKTNLSEDYNCKGFAASLGRPCLRRAPLPNPTAPMNQAVDVNPLHSSPT
ncbi:hypothetical protein Ancab_032589 [Ancistrocladus abbreviatus]